MTSAASAATSSPPRTAGDWHGAHLKLAAMEVDDVEHRDALLGLGIIPRTM
jgi:hypothetical protein